MTSQTVSAPETLAEAAEAARRFRERGFVHVRGVFAGPHLDCLLRSTDEIVNAPDAAGKWMKYYERGADSGRLLNRVEYFFDFWPDLRNSFDASPLGTLLEALFDGPFFLFKEKLNVKLDGGGGYAPHQDGPAWKMLTHEAITVMVAVDDADETNGALRVDSRFASGRRYLPHQGGRLVDDEGFDWQTIPMQAGDVIAFSSYLPHTSDDNRSGRSRRAYFVTYNAKADGDRRVEYFDFKRKAFPPEVERKAGEDHSRWKANLSRELL